jgi:mitochondrial FAD-linked sulfhydryl oxidase
MRNFFNALSRFYPCTYCANDFQQNIKQQPVQVQTRQELCIWLCEQHNIVNQKLGKEKFPCTMKQLDQRWRKSDNPKCHDSSLH